MKKNKKNEKKRKRIRKKLRKKIEKNWKKFFLKRIKKFRQLGGKIKYWVSYFHVLITYLYKEGCRLSLMMSHAQRENYMVHLREIFWCQLSGAWGSPWIEASGRPGLFLVNFHRKRRRQMFAHTTPRQNDRRQCAKPRDQARYSFQDALLRYSKEQGLNFYF